SREIDDALDRATVLVVEIANLDRATAQSVFAELSIDPSLPPLTERVGPAYSDELAKLLARAGTPAAKFRHVETWAVAMSLAALVQNESGLDPNSGVDRALIADFNQRRGKHVLGLETIKEQFRVFDRLGANAQQALLRSLFEQQEHQGQDMAR